MNSLWQLILINHQAAAQNELSESAHTEIIFNKFIFIFLKRKHTQNKVKESTALHGEIRKQPVATHSSESENKGMINLLNKKNNTEYSTGGDCSIAIRRFFFFFFVAWHWKELFVIKNATNQ